MASLSMNMYVFACLVFIIMLPIMKNDAVVRADEIAISIPPDTNDSPDQMDSIITFAPVPSSDPALVQCTSNITLYCAAEIIEDDELFSIPFEAKCCRQLIAMGKPCNDLIVHYLITDFGASKANTLKRSIDMHHRSDNLWNKCMEVVKYGNSRKELLLAAGPDESSKRASMGTIVSGLEAFLHATEIATRLFNFTSKNNGN